MPTASSAAGGGGATGYDGPEVSLSLWNGFTGGDGPIIEKLVQQFTSEHPIITVAMSTMQWADYCDKRPVRWPSGHVETDPSFERRPHS